MGGLLPCQLGGVDFFAVNTDSQALMTSLCDDEHKIRLGLGGVGWSGVGWGGWGGVGWGGGADRCCCYWLPLLLLLLLLLL
jgi:hypothetical protein